MMKFSILINTISFAIILFIFSLLNIASAQEFEISIDETIYLPILDYPYRAEQGIDFDGEQFYTSNGIVNGIVSIFSQDWQLLDEDVFNLNDHIGDITVANSVVYAPICSAPDDCLIRYYFMSDGLFTGLELDMNISSLGFQLAGLDYFNNNFYGIEYSETGTAHIVKFDSGFNHITQYEISSLYANGIEIVDYDQMGTYVFVTRGDQNEDGYIDIYNLDVLNDYDSNVPISSHLIPIDWGIPNHIEGLTIDDDQIWLAGGAVVLKGNISITHTITASAGSNGSIEPTPNLKPRNRISKVETTLPFRDIDGLATAHFLLS